MSTCLLEHSSSRWQHLLWLKCNHLHRRNASCTFHLSLRWCYHVLFCILEGVSTELKDITFCFWISFCYCSVFFVQQIQTIRCVYNNIIIIMQGQPHIYLCANTQNQALSSVPLPESYPGDHRTFQYPCTNRSQSSRSSLGTGGVAVTIHPSHGSQGKTSSQHGCLFYGCCGPTLSNAFPRPRLSVFCLFCTGF